MKNIALCPVCGSSRIAWGYSAPSTQVQDRCVWSVWDCKTCSHQFINPQPSWEELKPYYECDYEPYDPMHGSEGSDELEAEQAMRTGTYRHIPVPYEMHKKRAAWVTSLLRARA